MLTLALSTPTAWWWLPLLLPWVLLITMGAGLLLSKSWRKRRALRHPYRRPSDLPLVLSGLLLALTFGRALAIFLGPLQGSLPGHTVIAATSVNRQAVEAHYGVKLRQDANLNGYFAAVTPQGRVLRDCHLLLHPVLERPLPEGYSHGHLSCSGREPHRNAD